MNCEEYKAKYPEYYKFPLDKKILESNDYGEWLEHCDSCYNCDQWGMEQEVLSRGKEVSDYPCIHIAYHSTVVCDIHYDPWECSDMTLVKVKDAYGIPVRDGGTSFIEISHCPWCGIQL